MSEGTATKAMEQSTKEPAGTATPAAALSAEQIRAAIAEDLGKAAIDVRVTFPPATFPSPIVWPSRIALTEDENNARQAFYSQPIEAQEAGRQIYNATFLSSVLDGKPQGLPGFDQLAEAIGVADLGGYKKLALEYLSTPGKKAEMLATELVEQYNKCVKPAEFFR